ncbi:MAG: DUF971 domain-containing protein [Gammaproteobacteria bacterium]|nr:DUF971 domain-containing protein [Gammaproteobacteria bacterium]
MIVQRKTILHCQSSLLELTFNDGYHEMLSFELLRVHSPAIARHPSNNFPLLVNNKAFVKITTITDVTDSGLTLSFDDGHNATYIWSYLYQVAKDQDRLWINYLKRLNQASQLKRQPLVLISG